MLILKCTKAVQLLTDLKPANLAEPEQAILGAWCVNQLEAAKSTLSRYST